MQYTTCATTKACLYHLIKHCTCAGYIGYHSLSPPTPFLSFSLSPSLPSSYTHIIVFDQSIPGQFIDEPVDLAGVVHQSAVKVKSVDVGVFEGELAVGEHSMRVGLTAHKVICTECMVLVLMLMYTQ